MGLTKRLFTDYQIDLENALAKAVTLDQELVLLHKRLLQEVGEVRCMLDHTSDLAKDLTDILQGPKG